MRPDPAGPAAPHAGATANPRGAGGILEILSRPYYRRRPSQLLRRVGRALIPRHGERRVRMPWGVEMEIDVDEMVGRSIWETGVFDLAVSECCWRLLDPGDLAVDVGANIGYVTGLMAARTGPGGQVLAFEPHPGVLQRLRRNVARVEGRRFGSIEVHPVALSSESGTAALVDGADFETNQGVARLEREVPVAGVVVRTARLDSLGFERPIGLMKLDVEGHEVDVLRGAERLLETGAVRDIVFEDHQASDSEIRGLLGSKGYSVYALGWTSAGLILADPAARVARPFESPSYLATRDRARAVERLRTPGWMIFERTARTPDRG